MTGGRRRSGWATMAEVARRAGVSAMTVSRVFKAPGAVRPALRARVEDAARALGYVPNLLAGNLASSRSRMVAAVVPSLANSNFVGTVKGLADRLRSAGYQLLLADSGYDTAEEARAVEALLGRRPDGLVLTGTRHDPAVAAMLRASRVPTVETWELRGPFIDMAVGFSNYAAASALARLVASRGYRHVGYIDFPHADVPRFADRRRGVRAGLRGAGRDVPIVAQVADEGFDGGRLGLEALLAAEPRLDAVICATDVLAIGVIFECERRGVAVGTRMGVCGFGD
ncbi:MAG: LacI family DNA-binding transcriptional regulator, partial [Alphaproteobacteria bacterium]